MKTKHVLAVATLIAAAMLAAPAAAQYLLPSHCAFNDGAAAGDPAANGNARNCYLSTTKESCEAHWYCWWRDTTAQNALAQHTTDQFLTTVFEPYSSSSLKVLLYSTAKPTNVVALVGATQFYVVGMGGGRDEATAARMLLQAFYSGISDKRLMGLFLPNVYPETKWGDSYWISAFRTNPPAPVFANAGFFAAEDRLSQVGPAMARREPYAYGYHLTWGADSFLGLGWGRWWNFHTSDNPASYTLPTVTISEDTTIYLGGSVPVMLKPGNSVDAELIVWLPDQKIAIVPSMGRYFAHEASIVRPSASIDDQISRLDTIRSLGAEILIPLDSMYIAGAEAVSAALTAQYDALKYVRDTTIDQANSGTALDDIVNTLQLPANLAVSPFNQQLVARVPDAVRATYHEYLGWFNDDPARLATLSTLERATRMIAFGGGEGPVLRYAKDLLTEHTRNGAVMAIDVLGMLRLVSPSTTADAYYVQALKMLAFMETSAERRNCYLTKAYEVLTGGLPVPPAVSLNDPDQ